MSRGHPKVAQLDKGELKSLLREYYSYEAIANKFGVSRQAVFQQARKLKIARIGKVKYKRNRRILKDRKIGMTQEVLADKYEISPAQICRILQFMEDE